MRKESFAESMAWLPKEPGFEKSRIFSMDYKQFALDVEGQLYHKHWMLKLKFLLGGGLLNLDVGYNYPVVFVCHGLGCYIAKNIAISPPKQNPHLARKIMGFLFYSDVHHGHDHNITDYCGWPISVVISLLLPLVFFPYKVSNSNYHSIDNVFEYQISKERKQVSLEIFFYEYIFY